MSSHTPVNLSEVGQKITTSAKTSNKEANAQVKEEIKNNLESKEKLTAPPDNATKQIERFLNSKYTFRYNSVSNKVEFKDAKQPANYIELADFDYNSILREIKHADILCSISTLRSTLASNFVAKHDPYIEYVESLPQWDGTTDYIKELADTVKTTDDKFWHLCFRKWLVAMVASWCKLETINHTALILSGEQGIGKTTWLRGLIPQELSRYIYSGNLNVRDKDSQLKLSECCIIIMDELENMGRNLEALKELITKTDIYVRRAYGYTHEKYVRRASFAGSINNMDFLHDTTGNRRFLCFEAENIDYKHNIDLSKVYSQAYALAQQGFEFWFSKNEIEKLNEHNEKFRIVEPEEEQLTTFYEPCLAEDKDAQFMKTTDIEKSLLQLSGLRSISTQRLGRILKSHGFIRVKHKDRYVYVLKLKKIE